MQIRNLRSSIVGLRSHQPAGLIGRRRNLPGPAEVALNSPSRRPYLDPNGDGNYAFNDLGLPHSFR
jgi:hypothetical protein